ncbi:hypothetical protein GCM10020331_023980 [Ectobacillus funiculus]
MTLWKCIAINLMKYKKNNEIGAPLHAALHKGVPQFISTNHYMLAEELRMLGEEFRRTFSVPNLQELAYQTDMIQRKRKFRVQDLVSLCVFLGQTVSSESLVRRCTSLNEVTGVYISAETLGRCSF